MIDKQEWKQRLHFRNDGAGHLSFGHRVAATTSYLREMASRHKREPSVLQFVRESIAVLDGGAESTTLDPDIIMNEARKIDFGLQLLRASQEGNARDVAKLREWKAPVNFRDPRTGATPLHYVAAYRARAAFRALTKGADCDFLIRDKKGRLAWELAVNADDAALARLLIYKTRKQAEAAGVPFPPRRPPAEIPTPR